jgi:hypothetical protein
MTFLCAWVLVLVFWASVAAALSLQAFLGFIMGVIAVIAASVVAGLAAASVHHRRGEERDEWLGPDPSKAGVRAGPRSARDPHAKGDPTAK